jgi:hypothetical protein
VLKVSVKLAVVMQREHRAVEFIGVQIRFADIETTRPVLYCRQQTAGAEIAQGKV